MTVPTIAQREAALKRANEVRSARSRLKRQLHDLDYPEALELLRTCLLAPLPVTRTMSIEQLLVACRGLGRRKVNRLLIRAKVSPTVNVGAMPARRRAAVIHELDQYRQRLERTRAA